MSVQIQNKCETKQIALQKLQSEFRNNTLLLNYTNHRTWHNLSCIKVEQCKTCLQTQLNHQNRTENAIMGNNVLNDWMNIQRNKITVRKLLITAIAGYYKPGSRVP